MKMVMWKDLFREKMDLFSNKQLNRIGGRAITFFEKMDSRKVEVKKQKQLNKKAYF